MLRLVQIHKTYAKRDILTIPFLFLDKGIYWIKGVNGSGKTTLMKIIAGLIPFAGDVIHNDLSMKKEPTAYRKTVSWAMAEPLFPEFVTGQDLFNFYCNIRNTKKEEAEQLLVSFKMEEYVHLATGAYSSGMLKKLAIVLALVGKPSLIILDEPFITLDKETIPILLSIIHDWHYHHGINFIISSHIEDQTNLPMQFNEMTVKDKTLQFIS